MAFWNSQIPRYQTGLRLTIRWIGLVAHNEIPALDRSAHLLYSADINPACPNSVIEALACGLPVASFETGAIPELVPCDVGAIVPYGGDPWRLDPPDTLALANAALSVMVDLDNRRRLARERAEKAFGLDPMVDSYLDMLINGG